MSIKRVMPVFFILLGSIALGIYYNGYLNLTSYHSMMLPRYLCALIMIALFFVVSVQFYPMLAGIFEKSRIRLLLLIGYMCGVTIILYFLHRYLSSSYINALIMICIYPFVFDRIIENFESSKDEGIITGKRAEELHEPAFDENHQGDGSRDGILEMTIVFGAFMAICFIASDIKMLLFSGVMFILGEFLAIKWKKPAESRRWYWHTGILTVVVLLFLIAIVYFRWDIYRRRIEGLFHPGSVLEYRVLRQWLGRCSLIAWKPDSQFIMDISSRAACPYAHLMGCFGILFTIIFLGLQIYMVVCIAKNAMRFTDTKRKYFGMISAIALGVHLAIAILSSFSVIPMVEYGAPILVNAGLGYSYVPILLYFYLEYREYRHRKTVNNTK